MKNLTVKQFDIQEWLDNPAILVCTRSGEPVKVMSYNPERIMPVTFGVEIDLDAYNYDECYANGHCSDRIETDSDLFFYSYESEDEFEEHFGPYQEDLKEAIYLETSKNN